MTIKIDDVFKTHGNNFYIKICGTNKFSIPVGTKFRYYNGIYFVTKNSTTEDGHFIHKDNIQKLIDTGCAFIMIEDLHGVVKVQKQTQKIETLQQFELQEWQEKSIKKLIEDIGKRVYFSGRFGRNPYKIERNNILKWVKGRLEKMLELPDNTIVMQNKKSTGLHDKNGKEIFEGDSVAFHNGYYIDTTKVVRYKTGGWGLEGCETFLHELFEWKDINNKELGKFLDVKIIY